MKKLKKNESPESMMKVGENKFGQPVMRSLAQITKLEQEHLELIQCICGFWKELRESVQPRILLMYDDFSTVHENTTGKVKYSLMLFNRL
jgi:hypothetical protein